MATQLDQDTAMTRMPSSRQNCTNGLTPRARKWWCNLWRWVSWIQETHMAAPNSKAHNSWSYQIRFSHSKRWFSDFVVALCFPPIFQKRVVSSSRVCNSASWVSNNPIWVTGDDSLSHEWIVREVASNPSLVFSGAMAPSYYSRWFLSTQQGGITQASTIPVPIVCEIVAPGTGVQ